MRKMADRTLRKAEETDTKMKICEVELKKAVALYAKRREKRGKRTKAI